MQRSPDWRARVACVAAAFVLALLHSEGAAAESAGRALFVSYCASCHGVNATGDGPVAAALKRRPPDLTRLADRFGSPLSRVRVAEFIDGRLDVLSHGPRSMPVWGERFKSEAEPGLAVTEDSSQLTIQRIVDWLISIQTLQDARLRPQPARRSGG